MRRCPAGAYTPLGPPWPPQGARAEQRLGVPPLALAVAVPLLLPVWGAAASGPTEGRSSPRACVSFQAPTVTIEGFLQALSLAVDKQFEERKKLSSCI